MLVALSLLALAAAAVVGFAVGRGVQPREDRRPPYASSDSVETPAAPESPAASPIPRDPSPAALDTERARIIRAYEAESTLWRARAAAAQALGSHATELASERSGLFGALADARGETARYRDLVVAIEDDAPPPLLGGRGTPDDLKLIVGIGPVLERMLHQLGITSFRQIALWTERDIDAIDARLPEFPGRIRRDAWVVQARALHESVYGETPRR